MGVTTRDALARVVTPMLRVVASASAAAVASAGAVVGYGYALPPRSCACETVRAGERERVYERQAASFDDAVASSEYWSGIERMRARLVYGARGDG